MGHDLSGINKAREEIAYARFSMRNSQYSFQDREDYIKVLHITSTKGDILMTDLFGLFSDDKTQNKDNSSTQENDTTLNTESGQTDGKLELHKEELDITKNSVNAGEVVLSKEVVEEQKTIDVPVMHEEVVITRTPVNNSSSNATISSSDESIHIPVSQEEVETHKYTVTTEEISASKRQVSETQHIEETLRREEAKVDTTGSVNIVSGESDFNDINS
jgi:uncharacterized protein (TIGR02271 family)